MKATKNSTVFFDFLNYKIVLILKLLSFYFENY